MKIIQTVGVTAMTSVTQYFTKMDTGQPMNSSSSRNKPSSLDKGDWDQPIMAMLFSLNEAFLREDAESPDHK